MKTTTQKIKRVDLQKLYQIACNDWKQEITQLVLFQSGDEIEVEDSLIKKAYGEADKEKRASLTKYFTIKSDKIIDRVTSWNDILSIQDKRDSDILPYSNPTGKKQRSQNAFAKIQEISEVLNEGWIDDWNNSNQGKYYPVFKKLGLPGWSVFYGSYYYGVDCDAYLGCGAYYKSSEIALYAGNQFLDIYIDYLPE